MTVERQFRGVPVSEGICRGPVVLLGGALEMARRVEVPEARLSQEVGRLEAALVTTREQIHQVQRRVVVEMGAKEGGIFDAHLLLLEDRMVIDEVIRFILDERVTAEFAFDTVTRRYMDALGKVEDAYLRERASDLRDVAARVLQNLTGRAQTVDLRGLKEPCIIVAHDLSPSVTAQLDKRVVLGFATDIGGRTSHTAIMARSLGIPAVVGLGQITRELTTGDECLLDGFHGLVISRPSAASLAAYGQFAQKRATIQEKLREVIRLPAVTRDGHRVTLSANIEHASDSAAVTASGADGVGLFRTEYLFIERKTLPTEEEQFQAYSAVAAALKPRPVVIRTLDLGGDKFLTDLEVSPEINPFLGWRAIRFCLQQQDIFRAQLRAILRAGVEGNVRMMYPMLSGLEELRQATELLDRCKTELRAEGLPFDAHMETGAMIETPSAALVADALAKRLAFFSIGTNDLIQYTLAADRTNERVAHLYDPTHPAILRLIKMTVDAAHARGLWVSLCGEIAGEPALVPLLLGLGVDELSVAASVVPQVKYLVRRVSMQEARELAEFGLQHESSAEILTRCQELARRAAPELFEAAE